MAQHIELNPVSHLTIGAVGEPGKRTFFLQGGKGGDMVSLILEKVQAAVLADSFDALLEELSGQSAALRARIEESIHADLRLREPLEALFRVGNIGLGFDNSTERVVVVAYEAVPEEEEPNIVSFWASPGQIKALVPHTRAVVKAGRPICGNCGQPMDPEGHWCAHRNGHKK